MCTLLCANLIFPVPYSSSSIHTLPAHAAFTHRQFMQHSRTTSSCSIHAPPALAAFVHRQLTQQSRTTSSCSIHAPPAHAAFTHHQYPILTFWGRTWPRVNPGNCQIVHRSFPPLYCTGCTCGLEVKLGAEPPGILPLARFWSRPETEKVISVREGTCGG